MRFAPRLSLLAALALLPASAGCSASAADDSGAGGSSVGGGGTGGTLNIGGSSATGGAGGKLTAAPPCNPTDPNADADKDGFPASIDCNDCTAQMNPGAYDWPGNGVDEDCSGTPDDEHVGCDASSIDLASDDAVQAARVIGICKVAKDKSWGLVSARFVKADGTTGMAPLSHGLLPDFGPNVKPREGSNFLVLSSGTARRPTDPGYQDPSGAEMNTASYTPPGFPIDSPSCSVKTATDNKAFNPAALEMVIRTPTNANQLSFDFSFYTYEFPVFVCSVYNDFFVALVEPPPQNAQNSNVSFDSQGNPVSVNNGYLEVCDPAIGQTKPGGKAFACPLGTDQLLGTGFEGHAATGWLNTRAPIPGGYEITIRLAVWDMQDEVLDSTVLIDNFAFDVGEGGTAVTQPIPR